jgi:CTP synthase
MVQRVTHPGERVRIAVVGKYTDYVDSYKSVQESLIHGGIANDVGVDISWVGSDRFTSAEAGDVMLAGFDGLLVPGGFGVRGVEGMVEAIRGRAEPGCRSSASAWACRPRSSSSRATWRAQRRHSSEFAPECANP